MLQFFFFSFIVLRYADGVLPGQGSPDNLHDNDDDEDDASPPNPKEEIK